MRTRLSLLCSLGALLVACQSGAPIGTTCARSSECASPLVCRIGRCRNECAGARDCALGQVCLIDENGLGACELPAVDVCSVSCDPPLICASGHCRVECTADYDCPQGHVCTSGACQRADSDAGAPTSDAGASDAGDDAARTPLDAAIADAHLACDPVNDVGCSSMRCGLVSGAPTCIMAGSEHALGAPCTSETDCASTLSCQGGRCVRVCHLGDDSVCGVDLACSIDSVHGQDPLPSANGLGLCTEACDFFVDMGECPSGATCAFGTGSAGTDFTWCRDIGSVPEGGACTNEFDCVANLGCHTHVCRRFCTTGGTQCTGSDHCDPISTFAVHAQVGECTP